MSEHAVLSPSSMHRWARCPGALVEAQHIVDEGSDFAREGSAAHVLAERALTEGKPASFWVGEEIILTEDYRLTVDEEMADFVQSYVDQVERQPGNLFVEQRVDLEPVYGVDDQFGTADAVVLDSERVHIYVCDLKYGRGVQVFARDNEQLYSYAAGALYYYDMLADWETITVAVHQPRLNHYDEVALTRAELEQFVAGAREAAQRAYSLLHESTEVVEQSKVAGEKQCQWCPAKADCPTLASWAHRQVFDDFSDLAAPCEVVKEPAKLDAAVLGKILDRADVIAKWLSEVRAEGLRRVQAGLDVPGWKLVPGRKGPRKWSDEKEAEEVLKKARIKKADREVTKLVSPPQAEKLLKKKPKVWGALAPLIEQKEGAPALAPESDNRQELKIADADQFSDLTGE